MSEAGFCMAGALAIGLVFLVVPTEAALTLLF